MSYSEEYKEHIAILDESRNTANYWKLASLKK